MFVTLLTFYCNQMGMLIFNFELWDGIGDIGPGLPSKQGLGTHSHHKVPRVIQLKVGTHT